MSRRTFESILSTEEMSIEGLKIFSQKYLSFQKFSLDRRALMSLSTVEVELLTNFDSQRNFQNVSTFFLQKEEL